MICLSKSEYHIGERMSTIAECTTQGSSHVYHSSWLSLHSTLQMSCLQKCRTNLSPTRAEVIPYAFSKDGLSEYLPRKKSMFAPWNTKCSLHSCTWISMEAYEGCQICLQVKVKQVALITQFSLCHHMVICNSYLKGLAPFSPVEYSFFTAPVWQILKAGGTR